MRDQDTVVYLVYVILEFLVGVCPIGPRPNRTNPSVRGGITFRDYRYGNF
jgi:hypothetical protein